MQLLLKKVGVNCLYLTIICGSIMYDTNGPIFETNGSAKKYFLYCSATVTILNESRVFHNSA